MKIFFLIITWSILLGITSFADEYYIGQWEWCDDLSGEYWCAPQNKFLTGVIDLRSLPQQAQAGGTPQGWAFFSYSQSVNDSKLFNITNSLDKKINNQIINKIQNELGIVLQSTNVRDAIWEILTLNGDPTGQTKWKPLMPGIDLKRKIYFGSSGKIQEQVFKMFESKGWELVLETIQEDYRKMIRELPEILVAKHLDLLEEKYGVSYENFIPDDEIKIASSPHETTLTEDFNCSDADSLNCDLSWTETEGDIDIVSNQAETITTGAVASARTGSLSSSDHYSQISVTTLSRGVGAAPLSIVTCRRESSGNVNYYGERITEASGGDTIRLEKRVVTTTTAIAGPSSITISLPETIKVESNGSTIKGYRGGLEILSATDTAITTSVLVGFRNFEDAIGGTSVINDNFESADLLFLTTLQGSSLQGATLN